jgi:hypothetical protein
MDYCRVVEWNAYTCKGCGALVKFYDKFVLTLESEDKEKQGSGQREQEAEPSKDHSRPFARSTADAALLNDKRIFLPRSKAFTQTLSLHIR